MHPISKKIAPAMSYRSGRYPSNVYAQSNDMMMKTPPYVAYVLAKFNGCNVAAIPYSARMSAPKIPYQNGLSSLSHSHTKYPPPISQKPARINNGIDFRSSIVVLSSVVYCLQCAFGVFAFK